MGERRESVIGKPYNEAGQKVTLLLTWRGRGPHNVLIRRADGSEVVRPMRGLRRWKDSGNE